MTYLKNIFYIKETAMKILKLLAITALILSIVVFGGCIMVHTDSANNTDVKENTSDQNAVEAETGKAEIPEADISEEIAIESEKAPFGKYGWAVDTEDTSYFWKFTSDDFASGALWGDFEQSENSPVDLICKNTGVILSTETASEFAVTNERIFYEDNGKIAVFDLNSKTNSVLDIAGKLLGITEDGEYLVYYQTSETSATQLCTLRTSDMSVTKIRDNCNFVAMHGGKVYYSPAIEDYESASRGEIKLCSSNPDASDFRMIYHGLADLYDYPMGSACSIAQIRFSDEFIYFSYGAVAGSGAFYQGGNIVCVRYDGSGAQTLYSTSDGSYVDSEFTVNADGSVTALDVSGNDALYGFRDKYIPNDGRILWFDDITGTPTDICSYYPDESYDLSIPDFVNVTDKYAFFVTHHCAYNSEKNVGWRDYYEREKSIFYMIDRQTGEIVTSYEF